MPFVMPERWMTTSEVAEMLGVTKRTIENWRSNSKGPPYVKLGNIRYRKEDVLAWVESNIVKPNASKSKEEDAA